MMMCREAYDRLVRDDLGWIDKMIEKYGHHSLEGWHVREIVRQSADMIYGKETAPKPVPLKITGAHMRRMAHAIGLDNAMDNAKLDGGVYKAYRNGSIYNNDIDELEELVEAGYAKKVNHGQKEVSYHLTDIGFEAVAHLAGIGIRYTKEFNLK